MRKHPQNFEGGVLRDTMAGPTLFEKILSGEIPGNFIRRGDGWGSFLDVFPAHKDIHSCFRKSKSEVSRFISTRIELTILGSERNQETLSAYFDTSDFTVTIHDGPLAGQEIPHVHVHVIPRLAGDGGGALPWMFPNAKPPNPPDFSALGELCNKIEEANQ